MKTAAPAREAHPTALPIAVRRARADDREAVVGFASRTFDGWDYIPEVWDAWVDATDGVLLVATTQDDDRPVAVTRMTVLSATEGWLEGMRVDPAVRGRAVATNLAVAQLAWAHAHGVEVLRYLTGHGNAGSLRLGAHHDFRVVGERRMFGRHDDDRPPTERPAHLATLAARGLVLDAGSGAEALAALWRQVEADPTFLAGGRLYECRPWALQVLDAQRFAAHARAGEILVLRDGDVIAIAIMPALAVIAEDDRPHLALLAGDPGAALRLVEAIAAAGADDLVIRLPDPPPMLREPDVAEAWRAAGYAPGEWTQVVTERRVALDEPLPEAEPPTALVLREPPTRLARPARIGSAA